VGRWRTGIPETRQMREETDSSTPRTEEQQTSTQYLHRLSLHLMRRVPRRQSESRWQSQKRQLANSLSKTKKGLCHSANAEGENLLTTMEEQAGEAVPQDPVGASSKLLLGVIFGCTLTICCFVLTLYQLRRNKHRSRGQL
jgi:hypothetical protein